MIKLTYTGMCEDCEHADLVLESLEYAYGGERRKEWTARCIHANACDTMEDRMIEKYETER